MGTADVLQIVLEVEHGTIYTTETLKKLDSLTRALIDSRRINPPGGFAHPSECSRCNHIGLWDYRFANGA